MSPFDARPPVFGNGLSGPLLDGKWIYAVSGGSLRCPTRKTANQFRSIRLTTARLTGLTSGYRDSKSVPVESPYGRLKMVRSGRMEIAIQVQVEQLPEGLYLATSEEVQGLIAQGRTVAEALEVARDVARKLIEARRERDDSRIFPGAENRRDYTIVIAA